MQTRTHYHCEIDGKGLRCGKRHQTREAARQHNPMGGEAIPCTLTLYICRAEGQRLFDAWKAGINDRA